jgi:peptide/nickel transport system substrate-binding protein
MTVRRGLAALVAALLAAGCARAPREDRARPLRVLARGEFTSLDPHASFDDTSAFVLGNLFEGLVRFDAQLRLRPALARSWINPDDRTWRFYLDGGARFADGAALRGADVKFSIERLRSLAGSQLTGFVRQVTRVVVVDDTTVDVHTAAPVAVLNSLALVPIVSERHARAVGGRMGREPLGTGPYRLVAWEPGRSVVLEANPHRRPAPAFARVEVRLREADRFLEEMRGDPPDLALFFPRSRLAELAQDVPEDMDVRRAEGLAVYYLTFNLRARLPGRSASNPLRDHRLRRALSSALDRSALARGPWQGLAVPASQLVTPPVFGFDPAVPPVAQDAAAARRLLTEAGHPVLSVALLAAAESHPLEDAIAEQWRAAGVEARLDERPSAAVQEALAAGDFQVGVEGYGCTSGDASELLTYMLHTRDDGAGLGPGNTAAYGNPEVDRLADLNLRILEARERLPLLRRALRLADADLAYAPLVAAQDVYVVSRRLRFTPPVHGEVRLDEVGWAARR